MNWPDNSKVAQLCLSFTVSGACWLKAYVIPFLADKYSIDDVIKGTRDVIPCAWKNSYQGHSIFVLRYSSFRLFCESWETVGLYCCTYAGRIRWSDGISSDESYETRCEIAASYKSIFQRDCTAVQGKLLSRASRWRDERISYCKLSLLYLYR